jgi:hypothetical protein
VIIQLLSIADEASAVQHDSGETMPLLATFDLQLIQILQNFEIQRDDYANLAQDGATLATGSRFPEEPPMKESAARCVDGPQGSRERPYPGEAKDVPFEPADAICLDVRLQIGDGIMPTSKPALT